MQLYLNKKLEIWEVVHHKNKNKEDDRIENLEVIDASNHVSLHFAGVRRANLNKGVCNEKGVQSE